MRKYWDHVEIGDKIADVVWPPISRLQIAHFAAASDDFSPLHLDDDLAKNAGFNSAFAPGLMSLAFVEYALRAFAENMRIVSLSGTFQRIIWPLDKLTTRGLILRRYQKGNEHRIFFSIWCENQHEEIVMKGTAVCLMFKNVEHEEKTKSLIPPVSLQTHEALINKYAHLLHPSASKAEEKIANKELV